MKKKEDIACLNCGKLFHPARKESMFCCRECGIEYNKKQGKYKKTEEMRKKLSEVRKGKTPWNKGKKTSEESIAKFKESIKNVWTNEKRELQRQKQKQVWSDPELLAKHSEIMRESHSSEEVRQKTAEAIHNYNMTITDEEWKARYMKTFQTKQENGTLFSSKGETEIKEYIESLGFSTEKFAIGKGSNRFELDIYVPERKIAVEYNGTYYHATNGINKRSRKYHFNKNVTAGEAGIDLIQIWEDQWKNQKDIIKDILAARLGIIQGERIYARKCEIREVSTADYRDFCMKYHVQGYRSASVKLGLYYKDKLVQISSFNKARVYQVSSNQQYEWEWVRGCISSNNKVIGGTSKLFKYFVETYNPENILCYSDWNLFSGKGYEESGFDFIGFTGPDKFYITISSKMQRINRNPYAYQQYKNMVKEGKLFECYGCGSKKFVWYKK